MISNGGTTKYDLKQLIRFFGVFHLCQLAIEGGGGLPEKSVANLVLGTEAGTLVQRFRHHCVAQGTCQHLLAQPGLSLFLAFFKTCQGMIYVGNSNI